MLQPSIAKIKCKLRNEARALHTWTVLLSLLDYNSGLQASSPNMQCQMTNQAVRKGFGARIVPPAIFFLVDQ